MTAPTTVLPDTQTEIAAFYRRTVLDANRDGMVQYLTERHQLSQARAKAMIDQIWDRLTNRIVEDYAHLGIDMSMAERIMGQALAFLQLSTVDGGHGPARMPDIGWHTFILYTFEYEAFCNALAGKYMHHVPTDLAGFDLTASDCTGEGGDGCVGEGGSTPDGQCTGGIITMLTRPNRLADTVAAMLVLGPVDTELWARSSTNCSKCDGPNPHGKCTVKCDPEADCKPN